MLEFPHGCALCRANNRVFQSNGGELYLLEFFWIPHQLKDCRVFQIYPCFPRNIRYQINYRHSLGRAADKVHAFLKGRKYNYKLQEYSSQNTLE